MQILFMIPIIMFSVVVHECAHGWVADRLGDRTARALGRITLNPIPHIDPVGTLLVPALMYLMSGGRFIFAWAKPVPVTWQNLRHPRRDSALVALAGPGANLLMAFLWAGIAKLSLLLGAGVAQGMLGLATTFFYAAGLFVITINLILMILNLIPIPPLDGSRVVSSILPPRMAYTYEKIEPYGIWILLGLLVFGFLGRVLYPPVLYLSSYIRSIFGL